MINTLQLLRKYESQNITFLDPDGSWPVVWERARGTHVWDAQGRQYLDLTAAFGVAAAGHANPRVVRAGTAQMRRLPHAMGDVHPHAGKAQLARELSRLTYERWSAGKQHGKTIFCNSGFEAVEAALKTARLATGKPGIIAFEGAYHGLGYGTLNATHRAHFRKPFRDQLRQFGQYVPYPLDAAELKRTLHAVHSLLSRGDIGAVLIEPIQARGGIHLPSPDLLPSLAQICSKIGALLVVDEIYTGFGRTGKWFAVEHSRTTPDLVCLGKALTGGFPLSACVGRAVVMDAAWPKSQGEAIHTSTFLGNPVGCAMAMAQIQEIKTAKLVSRSAALGKLLLHELQSTLNAPSRGLGLMAGVELASGDVAVQVMKRMLDMGYIVLPEGEHGNVIGLTPPLTITARELRRAIHALKIVLEEK